MCQLTLAYLLINTNLALVLAFTPMSPTIFVELGYLNEMTRIPDKSSFIGPIKLLIISNLCVLCQ